MKRIISLAIVSLLMWSAVVVVAATNDLTGNWNGTLNLGPAKLRLVFRISKDTSGALTATLDSIDQGARNIQVDVVTVKDKALYMEVKSVNGIYKGTLDAAGTKFTGEWTQGPQTWPLILEKGQGTNSAFEGEKFSSADDAANKQAALKTAGTWNGVLTAPGGKLRLRLNLAKSATGAATGTMDSLDQHANDIPLSAITLKDGKVRFEVRGVGGIYEGTLAADGSTLTGDWQQGGGSLPLEFKKAATK